MGFWESAEGLRAPMGESQTQEAETEIEDGSPTDDTPPATVAGSDKWTAAAAAGGGAEGRRAGGMAPNSPGGDDRSRLFVFIGQP